MSKHYKEAIRLMQTDIDWKSVSIDYAQRHPADFCRSAMANNGESWMRLAKIAGTKIEAIKICRAATGQGLKEAKSWADDNWEGGK